MARTTIERLQEYLQYGVVWLRDPARHEFLEQLLAEATLCLDEKQPRTVGQPWIASLARELQKKTGRVSGALLLQVATALDLKLDERTAYLYAERARKV